MTNDAKTAKLVVAEYLDENPDAKFTYAGNELLHDGNLIAVFSSHIDSIRSVREIRESIAMRDAYDINDPKHPDYMDRLIGRAEHLEDR